MATRKQPSTDLSPEFRAMQTIVEALDPLAASKRARVLLACALIVAPHALTDDQVISAFQQARAES